MTRSITSLMPIVRMHRATLGISAMMKCCCRIAVVMLLWLSVKNLGNTGLAVTTDFREFKRLGRLTSPVLTTGMLFFSPEKVQGKYVMLHRPKEYIGGEYGVDYPSIWMKFSDDLLNWEDKESHLLINGTENSWEEKLGGSTPPLKTEKGWLVLYHGVEHGGRGILSCWRSAA